MDKNTTGRPFQSSLAAPSPTTIPKPSPDCWIAAYMSSCRALSIPPRRLRKPWRSRRARHCSSRSAAHHAGQALARDDVLDVAPVEPGLEEQRVRRHGHDHRVVAAEDGAVEVEAGAEAREEEGVHGVKVVARQQEHVRLHAAHPLRKKQQKAWVDFL